MKWFVALLLLWNSPARPISAPELALKDMQGNTHTLSEYRGKIVLLNFWATWCISCKSEMPLFVEIYKNYRDRGVVVLAVSVDDPATRKYVPQYARTHKMEFPVLVEASTETMHEFGLGDTVPSTLLLDTEGNVAGKLVGPARKKDLLRRLESLLEKNPGSPPGPGADPRLKQ